MSSRIILDSGARVSNGLNNLTTRLKELSPQRTVIKLKRNNSRYCYRQDDILIHWGKTDKPHGIYGLNKNESVINATNKRLTFELLSANNVPTPMFFSTLDAARQYLEGNIGSIIYCRTILSGHSGEGIVLARTIDELVSAQLYTVGVKNKGEYRVHVFRNLNTEDISLQGELQVIDITQKRRRTELHEQEGAINYDIRNLNGGWVYCRGNIEVTTDLKEVAINAVASLGLDFGAVDIIHDKVDNIYRVLEVNTAPGLSSPTTLTAYAKAIAGEV